MATLYFGIKARTHQLKEMCSNIYSIDSQRIKSVDEIDIKSYYVLGVTEGRQVKYGYGL